MDFYDTNPNDDDAKDEGNDEKRPYIHVMFDCCNVYQRIYRREDKREYVGWCPKCGRRLRIRIGADGTHCRFFRAE